MNDIKDYPMMLNAKQVAEIIGCSIRSAYDVMEQKDFPLVRLGQKKRVFRDEFFKYLKSKENQPA